MNTEDVQIDWEARCGQLVTQHIRSAARTSAKLAQVHLELDQARLRIRELEAEVARTAPAAEKLRASELAREQELRSSALRVKAARDKVSEANARLGMGQRGVIEDVISWLRKAADKLPTDVPSAGLLLEEEDGA